MTSNCALIIFFFVDSMLRSSLWSSDESFGRTSIMYICDVSPICGHLQAIITRATYGTLHHKTYIRVNCNVDNHSERSVDYIQKYKNVKCTFWVNFQSNLGYSVSESLWGRIIYTRALRGGPSKSESVPLAFTCLFMIGSLSRIKTASRTCSLRLSLHLFSIFVFSTRSCRVSVAPWLSARCRLGPPSYKCIVRRRPRVVFVWPMKVRTIRLARRVSMRAF